MVLEAFWSIWEQFGAFGGVLKHLEVFWSICAPFKLVSESFEYQGICFK